MFNPFAFTSHLCDDIIPLCNVASNYRTQLVGDYKSCCEYGLMHITRYRAHKYRAWYQRFENVDYALRRFKNILLNIL